MNNKDISLRFGKSIKYIVIVFILVILGLNSYYTINEQEQAVITTFGIPSTVSSPGLHFKIPFIQQVTTVDTTIKGITIGYDAATDAPIENESLMITLDYNFVNVKFFVEYKVVDPIKALYASQNPVIILKNIAQACIRSQIGSKNVDDVITTGKNEIQANIREKISDILETHDLGIQLLNVTIQDAEPPTTEVLEAFKAVETAKQAADTARNNANKYRNEQLPAATAEIDRILKESEAQKASRINEAKGQASRFDALYSEYIKFPLVTKQRMFYESMEELLPDLKVIIDNSDSGIQKILPLDPLIENVTGNTGNNAQTKNDQ